MHRSKRLGHPITSVGRGSGSEGRTVRLSTLTVRALFLFWEERGLLATEAKPLGVARPIFICNQWHRPNERGDASDHSAFI
jgi:hypothetical protein